ncbi:MAG: TIR domain-containing protein [Steroidobacteraceae bacterium]|nr:TIR domain-containing protein [Steroidobacteraceae bacterium]
MADVFISYARTDRHRVAPLVAAIEAQGWSAWWDPAITPGQEFDRLIARELADATAVVVVWTADSVESRWVRGEARDGADRNILVPLRMGNAILPIDFRALHTIELPDSPAAAQSPAFQEVLGALRSLIERAKGADSAAVPLAVPAPPPVATLRGRVAICVLPFANLSGDPSQQTFSDGITSDIITELARWRLLAVRSRSASFRFRGDAVDIDKVARELHVRYVVAGSVRRLGERIRINVELVDTETGNQVWAERFDRPQSDLFDVQDQVVQRIVSTLVGRVQVSDVERARRKPPTSLDAYECVLNGNAMPWDDPEGFVAATRLFERAIELDPGYGMAYGMLAMMRLSKWRNELHCPDSVLDEALELARQGVALDGSDSSCHALLSQIYLYRRNFERAVQHMRHSVAINPNNQWNVADLGQVLTYVGAADEAVEWFTRAREIDPHFDPPWSWRQAGVTYMVQRRFDQALATFAHIAVRTYRIAAYTAACHARLGDSAGASRCVEECLAKCPAFTVRAFMAKEPFRDAADSDYFAEGLLLAGLPA